MSTSLGISMGWAILAVPVGSLLMMTELGQVILETFDNLIHKSKPENVVSESQGSTN